MTTPAPSATVPACTAARDFPARPEHVAAARQFIAARAAGHPAAADAVTIGSELAANAVEHSGGPQFTVTVTVTGGVLRLDVADAGASVTEPHIPGGNGASGEDGRGLAIVTALTDRWGYIRDNDQAVTWCEFTA